VLKIGGSVLTGPAGYRQAAGFVESLSARSGPLVIVVSAEKGHTDALHDEARRCAREPEQALLDLLWSTGELRSVALLTLLLRTAGVAATGLNAHEAGLVAYPDRIDLQPAVLLAALTQHAAVVVPGFLATRGQQVVTLGRGGSDLSAIVIAARLGAPRCVLVKDVDGYFTADPAVDPSARPIPGIGYDEALRMAGEGCPLVQHDALALGRREGIEIVVRSLSSEGTLVTSRLDSVSRSPVPQFSRSPVDERSPHGLRHAHDSRRPAGRARNGRGRLAHLSDDDVSAGGPGRASGI
jgi:aspartokinase